MKLLVSLNNKALDDYLKYTNSFIIGLKDYSINYFELTIDEIEELLNKYQGIELFVSINKNIFNHELDDLEEKLIQLNKLNIKGILYYDLSIVELTKELNLNLDLCFHQTHMVTNYNICNYYYNLGVKYGYLSSEITCSEMDEINSKTDMNLMALFVGHVIISHSKRKLVSNYYEYINKDNLNSLNIIKEKNKDNKYYCLEDKKGTNILTYDILNGTKAFIMLKDKLSYGVLDSNLIDDKLFLDILKLYKMNLDNELDDIKLINEMENLIGNYDGFFFKKTIYKVK